MIKEDEFILFTLLWVNHLFIPRDRRVFTTEIIEIMGMNGKRAEYILEKWSHMGFWNYGTTCFGGWFEPGEIVPGRYFTDGNIRVVPDD